MKKKNILTLFLVILSFVLAGQVRANAVDFSQTSLNIEKGANFNLMVNARDFYNVDTIDLMVEYDPSILKFNSATDGAIMKPALMINNVYPSGDKNSVLVSLSAMMAPINGNGELTTLNFTALGDGVSVVRFTVFDVVQTDYTFSSGQTSGDAIVNVYTPDVAAPVVSNSLPTGSLHSETSYVDISVNTNEEAICKYSENINVLYQNMTNILNQDVNNKHIARVANLLAGQEYRFYVKCSDAAGNVTPSDYLINFKIENVVSLDTAAPSQPSRFSVSRDASKITLKWKNPTASDLESVIVVKSVNPLSGTATNILAIGETVYTGLAGYYVDYNIDPTKVYYYAVIAKDTSGNYSLPVIKKVNTIKISSRR